MSLSVLGLGLALGGCWAIAAMSGSPTSVGRHVFYVPVVLGAARFGFRGALWTGVAAALLAGPLVPGGAPSEIWLVRAAFFLGIGALVAAFSVAAERTTGREVELAERERRLQEQRTALIQTVSHEFRTPLTIIHGVSETLVQRQEALDAPLRPLAGALYRAERRLSDMVAVVLAAADALGDPLQEEPVDLQPLVREVAEDLGPGPAQRVKVDVGERHVVTSRSHARLLLRCLLDNAIRFSDPDDPVDVSVTFACDLARITIRDRGEGVDPAFAERAFEPFTQGDSSTLRTRGGLGLGLYTARQLARRLGGDVEVRPADDGDGGSVAIVELPQRRESDEAGMPR